MLNCETLESRHLLAATADIVVLIDSSESSATAETTRFEFAAELVRVLDQKLISRGIGGQPTTDHDDASSDNYPEAPDNRYLVIQWGSNESSTSEPVEPNHTIHYVTPNDEWEDADEAAQTLAGITGSGGNEDGWEAIHFASAYDDTSDPNDPAATAELKFRKNAAIHFLVITDGPEHDDGSPPKLGPTLAHRRNSGQYFQDSFDGILDSLKKEDLFDSVGDANLISDAVVTFIAGAEYVESELDSFDGNGPYAGYEILGADLNIQDNWDVDRREILSATNDATVFIYNGETKNATADSTEDVWEITVTDHGFHFGDAIMFEATVLPQGLTDSNVYYVTTLFDADADTFQVSETIGGPVVEFTSNGQALKVHVPAEVVKVTDDFTTNPNGTNNHGDIDSEEFPDADDFIHDQTGVPSYPVNVFNQPAFDGELYGYLTWATGGTYWDMDPLFTSGNDIDSPSVNMLMQAIADNMFRKIATQVADFNGNLFAFDTHGIYGSHPTGIIADIEDVDLLFAAFGTTDADTKSVFDLDENGAVDEFDLIRLIVLIYYTRHGDANLDGIVNSADQTALLLHWQHAHNDGWANGDFNGDGIVNAADLNDIGVNWLLGQP